MSNNITKATISPATETTVAISSFPALLSNIAAIAVMMPIAAILKIIEISIRLAPENL